MGDKCLYIPNDNTQDYPICRLKLVLETFEHSNLMNQPIEIHISPQSCLTNEWENVIIKSLGTSVMNSLLSSLSFSGKLFLIVGSFATFKKINKEFFCEIKDNFFPPNWHFMFKDVKNLSYSIISICPYVCLT